MEKMISSKFTFYQIQRLCNKKLRFLIALFFEAYADNITALDKFIEPNNKVKKYYKFDDIYKLSTKKKTLCSLHP